jgi:alcohol dehydrogenase class IV
VLSGLTDVEHGRSLCTVGPEYLNYTWDGCVNRYADVARILGAGRELSDKEAAGAAGGLLRDFLAGHGLDCTLMGIGLGKQDVEKIISDAYRASGVAFEKTLKDITARDVRDIVMASLQ